jgi:hypothetical protein
MPAVVVKQFSVYLYDKFSIILRVGDQLIVDTSEGIAWRPGYEQYTFDISTEEYRLIDN